MREFYLALVGALMVTALALILDAALALAVWLSQPGADRFGRGARPATATAAQRRGGPRIAQRGYAVRGAVAYGRG